MSREDRIRDRAYRLWEQAGGPDGRSMDFWLAAAAEIEREDRAIAPEAAAPVLIATEARAPAKLRATKTPPVPAAVVTPAPKKAKATKAAAEPVAALPKKAPKPAKSEAPLH